MNEHFFIYKDKYFLTGQPAISPDNRSFKYGDGLFETMRMAEGRILNLDFHFERFFNGCDVLQFKIPHFFSSFFFTQKINELLAKNNHNKNARIRLMAFRSGGGIFDAANNYPHYIIETAPLDGKMELNENGLVIDIFPDARKSCDRFANLKSNNYLPSIMAGLFAQKNQLDDAIVLNTFGRVCETAIANLFIINESSIYTPPLSEGCVAGTMRRWLIESSSLKEYAIVEKNISLEDVLSAEEVFLTNAIQQIRWVRRFRGKYFENKKIRNIYQYISENL
jgi:branched-chain amino acid aminotransferase